MNVCKDNLFDLDAKMLGVNAQLLYYVIKVHQPTLQNVRES
jgi:hypothetical protein